MNFREYLPGFLGGKKKGKGSATSKGAQPTPTSGTSLAPIDTREGVSEVRVLTPAEGTKRSPSSGGLMAIVRNFPWLVNDILNSDVYGHLYRKYGGNGEQIRAELSSIFGGQTINALLQEAQGVKAYFDGGRGRTDPDMLLQFASATIANHIYPAIDPAEQASYPVKQFRGDLDHAVKIIQGKKEYNDLIARGVTFADIREVAIAMVQTIQAVDGPVDQQLTANLDELKAYMHGKGEDIADLITRLQAEESTPVVFSDGAMADLDRGQDVEGVAEHFPKIPGYLTALSNPATGNLDNLRDALFSVNKCSAEIKGLNRGLHKALVDSINLVNDGIRLQRLRGYLQGYDPAQMPHLGDLDVAYIAISPVGTRASVSVGDAMESVRQVDTLKRDMGQKDDSLRVLRESYDNLHNKKYVPLAGLFINLVDQLYSVLGVHQSELGSAAVEPIGRILGILASFKGQLRKGKSELEVPLDVQGVSANLEQLLSGVSATIETLEAEKARTYTTENALAPVDTTRVAGDAAVWCAFVLDYALEEVKNDIGYLGPGNRAVLEQLKRCGSAVDAASAAPALRKLESANGENDSELADLARTIMHGGRLIDEGTRRTYQADALVRAREIIFLRNLQYHLSDLFTGIKIYEGSNDETSLRRHGVRPNPDDIADEYIRERIKAVTETLSEEGLVEKLRQANEQLGYVRATFAEKVDEAVAEKEEGIRADEREKTLAKVKSETSLVRRGARYLWNVLTKRRYVSNMAANALDYVGLGNAIDSIALGWYSMLGKRLTPAMDEKAYNLIQQRDDRISAARERLDQLQMDLTLGDMGATPGQVRAARAYFRKQKRLADREYTRQLRVLYQQ
ncbi:hypothetical protein KY361_04600 [Candidatus Woesearchaeota archaeon]|nr:hypothetical protein [Candidatus Woesearchaeota archaeon]